MKKQYWYLIGFSVATFGSLAVAYAFREKINEKYDYRTEVQLLSLDPLFRNKVRALLKRARKEGIELRVIEGHRSCERQNKLFAQGRTTPGNKVTNARCGQSPHNYSMPGIGAADVYEFKDGKILYKNPNWDRIGQIAVEVGLEWGGNWKSFKDRPHVQDLRGRSIASLYREFQAKG